MDSPKFFVRFYLRSKQGKESSRKVNLYAKVWLSGEKRYLYLTPPIKISPREWEQFASDGTATSGADPKLAKSISTYRQAVEMVITRIIATDNTQDLNREYVSRRVNGVVDRLTLSKELGVEIPIVVKVPTTEVNTCSGCMFAAGGHCDAPWPLGRLQIDVAPDFAAVNGICSMRAVRTPQGIMKQPNPKQSPLPFDADNDKNLIAALEQKGGRNE